jgi:hypothetical protein
MLESTEIIQIGSKRPRKYRAPWEKEGTYKYLLRILHRIETKLGDVRRTQQYIVKGLDLGGYLLFDKSYIHEVVCSNEVDEAVLDCLYSAGEDGRLPKDVAASLNKLFHTRRFKPWHIRFILRRMNRKLEAQIGEIVAEKRGMRWALTSFARKAWGLPKEEINQEENNHEEEKEEAGATR